MGFAEGERTAFPILLVLSDINWRDLEDFYRLRRTGGAPVFDGPVIDGRHVPGSTSGGARATYVPDRGVGWALVLSSLLFAVIHLPKAGDPRALATFFPGLLFGWMRSATGSIAGSVAVHAASNIWVRVLDEVFLR